ncbi:hypothetical protein SAMN05216474_0166 [Lishizhenia tianjinensis]|uniref:Uncharacterized protein n=1 Tax=Lishizhenia tianjinensis TaxID=477690 RepID=A0A1I6XGA3_9FLAO|nr:hypothetical protein [Lishizhenia tianjinensis]SFT37121.1 hypothetical protein SAMN05216474_0166 [Lishizhenia tianjinensis]
MRSISFIFLLIVVSCTPKVHEKEINWHEELLGFGQMWSDKDTAHQDFYYFGNLIMDSTKIKTYNFEFSQLRYDTLFIPNNLLYNHFKFIDSLYFKWKNGDQNLDSSAYIITKDSTGVIHLKKAYGTHFTPRKLHVKMYDRKLNSDVGYWKYRGGYYGAVNIFFDTLGQTNIYLMYNKNRKEERSFYKEVKELNHQDSVIINSFIGGTIKNRNCSDFPGIRCGIGYRLDILYMDSIYRYDLLSELRNTSILESYFIHKVDKTKDTVKIDYDFEQYHENRMFWRKPVARDVQRLTPPDMMN